MEAFRQLMARINAQVSVLNRSQQMVIGLCAVVIAGSLIWLTQWSGRAEYVPLLGQAMSAEESSRAVEALRTAGADYQIGSNGIMVRASQHDELIMKLSTADALPQRLDITFASLIKDESPFRSESENAARRVWALNNELATIISASPDVASANVIINPLTKRTLGGPSAKASASVAVTMKAGKALTEDRVRGISRLVAGAVAGLEPHMVAVVDGATGRPWVIPNPEDDPGFGILEERKKTENHLLAKIMEQLSYIPGVLVAVSAELEADQTEKTTTTWDDPQVEEDSSTETETVAENTGGEAGTQANVGTALNLNSPGQKSTSTESKTRFQQPRPKDKTVTRKGRFIPRRITAAINVPRSFVAGIFKAANKSDTEPSDAELEDFKKLERTRIQGLVQNVLMSPNSNDVQVDFYYDFQPGGAGFASVPGMALAGVAEGGMWDGLKGYLPQIGLGLLGVMGMMMMLQIVRKSSQVMVMSEAASPGEAVQEEQGDSDAILTVGGGTVGMAQLSDGYLTGQELDDDTLRHAELREQVSKLVNDDPQNAADLIRRWVQQPD